MTIRYLATAAAVASSAGLARAQLSEGFDSISALPAAGWYLRNNSQPVGANGYTQGDVLTFAAQTGATGSEYVYANYLNGSGLSTLSNWLLTPPMTLQNGQQFSFWTRTIAQTAFADRLQIRMSTAGQSVNVGANATDIGDFATLLLDINPTLALPPTGTAYPEAWTQYTVAITGVASPTLGRLAFRYFVQNGGPLGQNSNYIGIDTAAYTGTVPPVVTGACCLPTGLCSDVNFGQCVTLGGAYQGDGSTCALANCLQPGACCLPNFTCQLLSSAQCSAQSGVYQGNGSNCAGANCPLPPTGACCRPDGTCAILTNAACDAAGGRYQGNNSTCGPTPCPGLYAYGGPPLLVTDATGLNVCNTAVAADITIAESFTVTSVDAAFFIAHPYQGDIKVTLSKVGGPAVVLIDRPGFPATSFGFSTDNYGTSVSVPFRSSDPASQKYDTPPLAAGINNPSGSWKPENVLTPFVGLSSVGTWRLEVQDCYPGDAGALNSFALFLGRPIPPPSCYANCDASTNTPCLNVNDFSCFLNAYAAGATYANCDFSTLVPVLNVNDFSCFLNSYAASCANPCLGP